MRQLTSSKPRLYEAGRADRSRKLDGLRLASFRSRAAAVVIDCLIAGLLFMGMAALAVISLRYIPGLRDWQKGRDIHIEMNFVHNWYSLVYTLIFFGLSLYWGRGRTLGKRLLKIRVVPLYHDHLSLWHCFERALGYAASAAEAGFGFFQYFTHPNRQTVHDRIAETIVVDETRR